MLDAAERRLRPVEGAYACAHFAPALQPAGAVRRRSHDASAKHEKHPPRIVMARAAVTLDERAALVACVVVCEPVDGGLYRPQIRGLHEVMIETGVARAVEVLGLAVSRQCNQQRLLQRPARMDSGRELVAVH